MPAAAPARGGSWTAALGAGMAFAAARRCRHLRDEAFWTRWAGSVQRRQLRRLLVLAADTRFGREHGFGRLIGLPEPELLRAYRAAVPLGDWATFRDLAAQMREHAEPDVLWPGVVRDFAQTSGTTAGEKYIPVSRQMLRSSFRASMDMFAILHGWGVRATDLFAGRLLFLGGSTDLEVNAAGTRTGDLSGIVVPMIRWPVSRVYLPGREIAHLSHWPTKLERIAELAMDQDVRLVAGIPSWLLLLFDRVLGRARALGRRADCIRDIWPNLRVMAHGGVRYEPFEPRVRRAWSGRVDGPDVPARIDLYAASEAFIAIQDRRGEPGLRLMTDIGNFFEFVPLGEHQRPDAPAFAVDEVEPGERYAIAVSSCAGLWRFVIGDVVEFDTVPRSGQRGARAGPPRLRIVGRTGHFVSTFGEHVIVEQVENAVTAAARESGIVVGEFTAGPRFPEGDESPALELAIEIEGAPASGALERFAQGFDAALQASNLDYTAKRRDDLGMGRARITPLAPGTFNAWMASRGKLGGQHKCPRCANDRRYLDELTAPADAASPRHAPAGRT